jgi:hypothetical protein
LQELNPNSLLALRRRQQTFINASINKPVPQYCRVVRQPSVAIFKDLLINPSVNLPINPLVKPLIIRPFSFFSCFYLAFSHTLRRLAAYYTAYSALHFASTDGCFKLCCKKGNVILPPVREPSLYLKYLFINNNPLCYSFSINICTYNCVLTFTFVSYKKDTRINFFNNI